MEHGKQIVCMCIVAKRKQKDELVSMLQSLGINFTNVVYGKGVVKAGVLQNILGLIPEENKIVLFSMTTAAKATLALAALIEKFHFDKPNTGIAFTIPVEEISY